MEISEQMIEAAARAICASSGGDWELLGGSEPEWYYRDARAALTAALAAAQVEGVAAVKIVPDTERFKAAVDAAAPTQDEGGVASTLFTEEKDARLARSRGYRQLSEQDFTGHMDSGRRTAFYEGFHLGQHYAAALAAPAPESDLAAKIREILDRADADDDRAGEYIDPVARRLQIANRTINRIEAALATAPASAEPEGENND